MRKYNSLSKDVTPLITLLENTLNGDVIVGSAISAADFALYPFTALLRKRAEALPYFSKTYPPHWKD